MEKLRLGLVGCGGMGTRHLHGLKQLAGSNFDLVELSAVCDINAENAAMAAACSRLKKAPCRASTENGSVAVSASFPD